MDRLTARVVERVRFANIFRLFQAMSMGDAYKVLGLPPDASKEEIEKAYKKKVFENHPDRGGSNEKTVEINVARDILEGRSRPTFEHERDPFAGPGVDDFVTKSPDPRRKPEKRVVTFEEAHSTAGIPSGVEWKFKSTTAFGGYGDTSNSAAVFYGQTATNHVFAGLSHHQTANAFTGDSADIWDATCQVHPLHAPLDKLAPKVIREIFEGFKGFVKGYNAKVEILPAGFTLVERSLLHHGHAMAFKDAMVQLGFVGADSPWATNRKISVVMILNSDANRRSGDGGFRSNDTISLFVNGKEFALNEASVARIKKSRILTLVYGTYYYFTGDKKDVTRSKNGKKVMTWLADNLTGEPQDLLDTLRRAGQPPGAPA